MRWQFLALSATALTSACGGGGSESGGQGSGGGSQAGNEPFLQAPFSGNFITASLFDHDLPQQFVDNNGYAIDHTGTRRTAGQPGAFDGHEGHDWLMPVGTPLVSASPGVVRVAGDTAPYSCPVLPGSPMVSNKEVMVEHESVGVRHLVRYVHLSSVTVSVGGSVSAGQSIGASGNTGCSASPHLHFQVYRLVTRASGIQEWVTVDPYGWTGSAQDPWAQHVNGAASLVLWKPGQAPSLAVQ